MSRRAAVVDVLHHGEPSLLPAAGSRCRQCSCLRSSYSEPGGYINFMQDDDYGKIVDN